MDYLEKMKQIRTFIFDVDGVLTDGTVTLLTNGDQIRKMHTRDGLALRAALKMSYRVAVISGGTSESVRQRLVGLGVQDVYLGILNKKEILEELVDRYDLKRGEICYMGDDLPDFEVMQMVGLSACPSDSANEILQIAQYISSFRGGEGCVRDVIEKVMRVQDKWNALTSQND